MDLTVSSFFHYYMFDPGKAQKNSDRVLAMITTIALGVLSLGIAHLICYLAFYDRHFVILSESSGEQESISQVYRNIIDFNPDEGSVSSWEDSSHESVDDEVKVSFEGHSVQDSRRTGEQLHVTFDILPEQEGSRALDATSRNSVKENVDRAFSVIEPRLPIGRNSRLTRCFSEKKLKKAKKREKKKNQKELRRSFSLKNFFKSLKHKKRGVDQSN